MKARGPSEPQLFSSKVPGLRLIWDATCLDAYMRDPLLYYWEHVEGRKPLVTPLPLLFGQLYHRAMEVFWTLHKASGAGPKAKLATAIQDTLADCHTENLDEAAAEVPRSRRTTRNLIRALVWYAQNPGLPPSEMELPFCIPFGLSPLTGEPRYLTGTLDALVEDPSTGHTYVRELKTTENTITSASYWRRFVPNVQLYTYDLAASYLDIDRPLRGVEVEACQLAKGFVRFERKEFVRTPSQRAHWKNTLNMWMDKADRDAERGEWPMNPAAQQYDSILRRIQTRPPESWRGFLEMETQPGRPRNPIDSKD